MVLTVCSCGYSCGTDDSWRKHQEKFRDLPNDHERRWSEAFAYGDMADDFDFVLQAVGQRGALLRHASAELRRNPKIVRAAVAQDAEALQFVVLDESLSSNRDLMLAVVQRDGLLLRCASRQLQSDREVVLRAMESNADALQFAAPELRADTAFLNLAVARSSNVSSNREIMLAAVKRDGLLLGRAPPQLRGDRELALAAVRSSAAAMMHASPQLRADAAFVKQVVNNNSNALDYAVALVEACSVIDRQKQSIADLEQQMAAKARQASVEVQVGEPLQVLPTVSECRETIAGLKQQLAHLQEQVGKPLVVLPTLGEIRNFLDGVRAYQPEQNIDAPVWALRWSHKGIDAKMSMVEEHDSSQESIFKLLEQLLRGRLQPQDITAKEPLTVYVHNGPDGVPGLYSRKSRRLVALMMYQACRREEVVMAKCIVRARLDPKSVP